MSLVLRRDRAFFIFADILHSRIPLRKGMSQQYPERKNTVCTEVNFIPSDGVGACEKYAGGMFLATDRSGYAAMRELR